MQGPLRHEVHRAIEQPGELVLELVDREPEVGAWHEHVEQIDIARLARFAPGNRAEYRKLRHAVPPAQLGQTRSVDGVPIDQRRRGSGHARHSRTRAPPRD